MQQGRPAGDRRPSRFAPRKKAHYHEVTIDYIGPATSLASSPATFSEGQPRLPTTSGLPLGRGDLAPKLLTMLERTPAGLGIAELGPRNMRESNKASLRQQMNEGKTFILAANPYKPTGSFKLEVEFLKENGYRFRELDRLGYKLWEAYR